MSTILFERKLADDILIEEVREVLNAGGIAVLPSDTIPGIGCRADSHDTILELFKLKGRPLTLPIPVILADSEQIKRYAVDLPQLFHDLTAQFWPGALTTVVRSNGKIPKVVGGGRDTIGFRVPAYDLLRGIVRAIGCPLVLTSANPHKVPPSALHPNLLSWWNHKVNLIILGRSTVPHRPSTVVDLSTEPPSIVRDGPTDMELLNSIIEKQTSARD